MTQEQLARNADVSLGTVQRTELSTTQPTLATLRALARGLGTSIDALLGEADPEAAA